MKENLLKTLSFVSLGFLAISIGASVAGSIYGEVINDTLRIYPYKVVNKTEEGENTQYYQSKYSSAADLISAKKKAIQDICEEGTTLLKNKDNALPLKESERKVSLFGRNSTNWVFGTSNGAGKVAEKTCDSLETVLTNSGFQLNNDLLNLYKNSSSKKRANGTSGYTIGEIDASEYTDAVRSSYSAYSDAAFVVLSRTNGEGTDFFQQASQVKDGDGTHVVLGLQDRERQAIAEAKKCSSKVIVLLNSDYPLEIEELKNDDEIDAILWCGATGVNGLYGTVKVITGEATPSGHTTDTFAVSSQSSPAFVNFGDFTFTNADEIEGSEATKYVVYQEGIYVGYKYYETRYEDQVLNRYQATSSTGASFGATKWNYNDEVSYSFGYGLSYTTFQETIKDWKIDVSNRTAKMTVEVKNTGSTYAGKHVVQLFAQSPYTDYDIKNHVEKSAVQLLDFEKTGLIQPGKTEEVTLNVNLNYLASYDYTTAKTFIWDDGDYYFSLGNGAHDALNNILASKGKSTNDGMDYNGDKSLVKTYKQNKFDKTTFSKSKTGETITNHLNDTTDLNSYEGMNVTYLTRSAWQDTFPTAQTLTASAEVKNALKDGASYVKGPEADDLSEVVEGTNYASKATDYSIILLKGEDYGSPLWGDLLNELTLEELAMSVSECRTQAYPCSSIGFAGAIATDGPQGIRNTYLADDSQYKISGAMFQSECILACTWNKKMAALQGEFFGEDGLWTNVSGAWAPGSNTHRTPYCGRNCEYFSEDGVLAGLLGAAECQAANEYGTVMEPKHFALNDQETNRGGLATFVNEQEAREVMLRAFEIPFSETEYIGSMASENRIGCTFSGAHSGLINDIVHGEWGMQGGFISDMISSAGYLNGPAAIIGGLTMVNCNNATAFSGDTGQLSQAVVKGDAVLFKAVKEAVHHNLYMWVNSHAMNGVSKNAEIVYVTPWWKSAITGCLIGFSVTSAAALGLLVFFSVKRKEEM